MPVMISPSKFPVSFRIPGYAIIGLDALYQCHMLTTIFFIKRQNSFPENQLFFRCQKDHFAAGIDHSCTGKDIIADPQISLVRSRFLCALHNDFPVFFRQCIPGSETGNLHIRHPGMFHDSIILRHQVMIHILINRPVIFRCVNFAGFKCVVDIIVIVVYRFCPHQAHHVLCQSGILYADSQPRHIPDGIRTLTYNYYDGARSFMGNAKFETPESLKGVVCRTPGAAPYVESISALGATPYNIAWSEVYNGIQTKAIDACEVQYTSAVSSAMYEVCKYVSKTEHINLFNMVICGEKWFSQLPAEYQEILLKDFFDAGYANAQEIIAAQETMEATLVEKGMEIVNVDKAIFMEAAEAAYAKLGWTELRTQLYAEAGLN